LKIHILTINRAPAGRNYFDATEQSLLDNVSGGSAATVFLGNQDRDHLSKSVLLDVECPSTADVEAMDGWPVRHKSTFNYIRALQRNLGHDLLLVEDDILFTRNLNEKLAACIKAIPVSKFILSLYAPFQLSQLPIEQVDPNRWYGTAGMYFPAGIRMRLADFMLTELRAKSSRLVQDLCIQRFCEATGTPLFVCNPNLVQHVGRDSSGTTPPESFHQSPTFQL
jgi:hypothetical protein